MSNTLRRANTLKNGAPRPKVIEPLTTVREYPVQWQKPRMDLAKLASLRWTEGMSIKDLAVLYGKSPNAIKLYFRLMKRREHPACPPQEER